MATRTQSTPGEFGRQDNVAAATSPATITGLVPTDTIGATDIVNASSGSRESDKIAADGTAATATAKKVKIVSIDFAAQMIKCVLIGLIVIYVIMIVFTLFLFIAQCFRYALWPCIIRVGNEPVKYVNMSSSVNGEMNWMYAMAFPWVRWPKTKTCGDRRNKARKIQKAKNKKAKAQKKQPTEDNNDDPMVEDEDNDAAVDDEYESFLMR